MDDNSGFNEVNGTGGDDDLVGTSGNDALNGGEGVSVRQTPSTSIP